MASAPLDCLCPHMHTHLSRAGFLGRAKPAPAATAARSARDTQIEPSYAVSASAQRADRRGARPWRLCTCAWPSDRSPTDLKAGRSVQHFQLDTSQLHSHRLLSSLQRVQALLLSRLSRLSSFTPTRSCRRSWWSPAPPLRMLSTSSLMSLWRAQSQWASQTACLCVSSCWPAGRALTWRLLSPEPACCRS